MPKPLMHFFAVYRLFAAALIAGSLLAAPAHADDTVLFERIKGLWLTENKEGGVEFYQCGDELCGKFHWLGTDDPAPDSPEGMDTKNKNAAQRGRALCGMQFMGGFKPDDNDTFRNGWIYSPRHGGNFNAQIRLIDRDHIELRGYFLIPILGQDQIWTRKDDMPHCRLPATKEPS